MKHTSGPWESRTTGMIATINGNIRFIAKIDEHPNEGETDIANALLIAAAPEILKSLKQTVSSLEYWFKRYGDPEGINSLMMQNARAAITAAEGGTT